MLRGGSVRKLLAFLLLLGSMSSFGQQVMCNIDSPDYDKTIMLNVKSDTNPFAKGETFTDESRGFHVSALYLSPNNILKTYVYGFKDDRKLILYSGEHLLLCTKNIAMTSFGVVTLYAPPYYHQLRLSCWLACGVTNE